jgi:hypothetical protein
MTLLQMATHWVNQGYSVIPINYYDKRPAARLLPNQEWGAYQKRLPTQDELQQWFQSRLRNIALVTGWNNLVVVDFDQQSAFECWWMLYPILTYMVKTARGMHVYLKINQPVPNYHSEILDIKSEGGYVLIPPSFHPTGYQYTVFLNQPILEIDQLNQVLPEDLMPVREVPEAIIQTPMTYSDDPWETANQVVTSDLIEHIRNTVQLLDFFPDAIRKSHDDRWWVAKCPFHHDHNPSFWIDTQRKICGCYAGCTNVPLDAINLYSKLYGLSNRDAIFALFKLRGREYA